MLELSENKPQQAIKVTEKKIKADRGNLLRLSTSEFNELHKDYVNINEKDIELAQQNAKSEEKKSTEYSTDQDETEPTMIS